MWDGRENDWDAANGSSQSTMVFFWVEYRFECWHTKGIFRFKEDDRAGQVTSKQDARFKSDPCAVIRHVKR